MGFYTDKKILVTGGTGLIGRPLVELLIGEGARVRIASLDDQSRAHPDAEFCRANLTRFDECLAVCKNMDMVFHLAGVKGSPKMTKEKPASFFVPTILFNTAMMEAARQCGVGRYLFTSTIGVYQPAPLLCEDEVWKTFPSEHDRFAGWAKRMGELQAEAYRIQYGWNTIAIVRPANVYGPYDNFDPENAMVIPSLIRRAVDGENPLSVWGDGTQVRDFIHARDVARGMMMVLEHGATQPINLGSGVSHTIREVAEAIAGTLNPSPRIVWDTSKPSGDQQRLMDVSRAKALGFSASIPLQEGIREVIVWYRTHKSEIDQRHNPFREQRLA